MAAEAVKVIVRCRPMNEREKTLRCENVVYMDSKIGLCQIKNPSDAKATPKNFTFDGAYYVESTTEQIYNDIGYPLVEGVTEGYNGTIFAYGQTGCGKSYTMQGVTEPSSQRGVIPRAFDHIFETISVADTTKFLVHASYCEIYNEDIHDLLGKDVKAKLDLKEHPDKGVYVQGLSMHPVHNVSECERVMEKGWKNRATGATLMNSDSSRSHSIFTIHLEMITKDEQEEEHIRAGKLNLVDLAGSERQAKTGATGDRLKEATKINLSLSALGNVISALVDGKSKHIPYRDSKLTRLLQDSLGGNTKTLMVACLSPADNNYDETLSTLRYANRAKNIKNKPKINEDPKDALLREYQEEIQRLKAMLSGQIMAPPAAEGRAGVPAGKMVERVVERDMEINLETSREELEREKERMKQEYDQKLKDIHAMYEEEKINKNKLQQDMSRLRVFYDERLSNLDGQISHLPTTAEVLGEVEWKSEDISLSSDWSTQFETNQANKDSRLSEDSNVTEEMTRLKQFVEDDGMAPRLGPGSLGNVQRPEGPGTNGHFGILDESHSMEVTSVTSTDYREDGSIPASRTGSTGLAQAKQRAIHLSTSKAPMVTPGVIQDNLPPDHMDLLRSANPQMLTKMHKEAVDRLHELQMQMVGGENADDEELKHKRLKRKEHADDRQLELAKAINEMDDDGIMLRIYDTIQDEVHAKREEVDNAEKVVMGLKQEIKDIQAEFELDRADYLDTIRRQEKQLKLYKSLVDRIHPVVRRDCNYFNLDKIKTEAKFDEDTESWILPKLSMERTALPMAGVMPGGRLDSKTRTYTGEQPVASSTHSDDRLRRKLEQTNDSMVDSYFQSKRASQLLSHPPPEQNNLAVRRAKQQLAGHSIQLQQGRFSQMNGPSKTYQNGTSGNYQNGTNETGQDDLSSEKRAAFVHGTANNAPDEIPMRRPQRLEALNPQTSKKSKKKRNVLEPV